MELKQKKELKSIVSVSVTFVLLFVSDIILKTFFQERFTNGLDSVFLTEFSWLFPFFLYLSLYFLIGKKVISECIEKIIDRDFLDEDFLMTVASLGAIIFSVYSGFSKGVSEGISEACAVMIFFRLGEWLENHAVSKSKKSLEELMDIRPDKARIIKENNVIEVSPSKVCVNDLILVKTGERIPLDGVVIKGTSNLDLRAITGESEYTKVGVGDKVISGSVNIDGVLQIRVEKTYKNSTVSKILELVENASVTKSEYESFISKFAKKYTPIVVFLAIVVAVFPPLLTGFIIGDYNFDVWIMRALSFLVVSCPCALVISVPLCFFSAIGGASKKGVLIKGSEYLEKLNDINVFAFDKTGTLTEGKFSVKKVVGENKEYVLKLACILEKNSNHPIAKAIVDYYGKNIPDAETNEIVGKGVIGQYQNEEILCGNAVFMAENNVNVSYDENEIGTTVFVAKSKEPLGYILLTDKIRDNAAEVISDLNGIGKTVMLSGDKKAVCEKIAKELSIRDYRSSLLPQEKAEYIIKLQKEYGEVCFVGDGINDAPVLTASSIGISMGKIGSDAAIEASNIVLMKDDLNGIKRLKILAKKTMIKVRENVIFSIIVKVAIMILSAFGIVGLSLAVIGDVGVLILTIINSISLIK